MALLIGSGILTIFIPALFGSGSSTPVPSEPSTVTITFPIPIAGQTFVTLPSWLVMLGLALIIPGLVIGAGLTLGIIYIILSRLVTNTAGNPEYQAHAAVLDKRQEEKIKTMRQTRQTSVSPESRWQRWAVFTTGAVILLFVGSLALLFSSSLFPDGLIARQDALVNLGRIFVLASLLIALVVMIFTLRSERLVRFDQADSLSIPWNFLAVLISGLLVVGLGIGILLLLNTT
ncbi:MAG: hypothetical protein R6X18_01480 [Chloroflexota bacterium]|jgi:hypothetical protein